MGVKVVELDEVGDRDAPEGSRPWAIYFVNQTKLVRNKLNTDVEMLQILIDTLQKGEAWKPLGLASFSMLATSKIGLQPEEIDAIIKAKKGVRIGDVLPLNTHGGDRRSDQHDKNENIRMIDDYGTSATYRIAKLKRDAPEFAARLEAGEFSNVREAERAAGFRVPPKLTRVERVKSAFSRLNDGEKREFLEWLRS